MSQISRRNFMKCAGAAALAIAASGILTGCDNTLDVEVTFVYNGQTLPLRGTGKVVTGEQYMDTATIVLPAEYQEQYKVRAEKVKVIRENGTRKAVVELVVKTAVWTVSYRLGEKEVLSGSVEAAAVNPTVTVTVWAPGFLMPRIVMQRCSASIITMTPWGARCSMKASAIWAVRRS